MNLIPAIDLLDGRCVRLVHGDFRNVTFYEEEPEDIARRYQEEGARWLHVVDLAASRDGESADTAALFKLIHSADQMIQTGGGVRSGTDIVERLQEGADRVVIGSLCAKDPERFLRWVAQHGADRIVAALDVQIDPAGVPYPRIFGWTEAAGMDLWTLLDQLMAGGLRHALVTDISRDGAMKGPNVDLYRDIITRYPDLQLQASGGVSRISDLVELKEAGATSVIVGKALLEGAIKVPMALSALR
jgi:phosphoribosylformimino-5-aminoimidazole carboxamide ribotide isomerase